MKEFACYIIPINLVFGLIGIIESAMLFEKAEEELTLKSSIKENERKEDYYGNIESREFM